MSQIRIGFSKVNISPHLGCAIYGYYVPRYAKGYIDELEASALVLEIGNEKSVIISIDNGGINTNLIKSFCDKISEVTDIHPDKIFISATHTHNGPFVEQTSMFEVDIKEIEQYVSFLRQRLVDCVLKAVSDMRIGKFGYVVGQAPERVAYIRRYKMKDGTTMTCPPINDPNVDYPIGELDQRVNILRFDREGTSSIVIVNYGLHADTVNGEMISSDWPGWMRKTLYNALGGVECMFIPGAQGDVGSTNLYPKDGDMNDTEISFDNEMKSPGMARFIGRALAGTVLQVYDKVKYVDVNQIKLLHKKINVPANIPNSEDLPLAHKYKELHDLGRDCDIPYEAMELTTAVAEAARMVALENGPEYFIFELIGMRIGEVSLVGIPGEPFTEIGIAIKNNPFSGLIMPCAISNGYEGYFPMKSAYDEGGYEARSSPFKSGVAELIIQAAGELLEELQ